MIIDTLLVLGSIFGYVAIATLVAVRAYWTIHDDGPSCPEDASIFGVFIGMFWPIGTFIWLGVWLVIRGHRVRHMRGKTNAEREHLIVNAKRELAGLPPLVVSKDIERARGVVVRHEADW